VRPEKWITDNVPFVTRRTETAGKPAQECGVGVRRNREIVSPPDAGSKIADRLSRFERVNPWSVVAMSVGYNREVDCFALLFVIVNTTSPPSARGIAAQLTSRRPPALRCFPATRRRDAPGP
jgi:hypothetical protein